MQTIQIEVSQTCNDRILSDVEALNPEVIDLIHSNRVANLIKYPIIPTQKKSIIKDWTNPKKCRNKALTGNYGVITGKANNIVVVDIYNKDDGFEEFQLYIDAHGLPNTYTVRTPGKGLHFYLNHTNPDENDFYLIENNLPSDSKYRGKGIDIKNKGGGVVGPGSSINDIPYTVINNSPIIDMPSTLIIRLLEHDNLTPPRRTSEYIDHAQYKYMVEDDILIKIFNKLEDKYLNIVKNWVQVLSAVKSLNKYTIVEEWSKGSEKYDKYENDRIWNHNSCEFDINFI